MSNIQSSWKRISTWYKVKVPERDFTLAQGASKNEIGTVEAELGLQFPESVRESYRLHNGSNEHAIFPYGFHLLSLEEIVKQSRMWRDLVHEKAFEKAQPNPKGPIRKVWWNLKWMPITHNAGGDHQCVDLDPDADGSIGQIIKFSHEVGPQKVLAVGLDAWLNELADALEMGKYRFDEYDLWLVPSDK